MRIFLIGILTLLALGGAWGAWCQHAFNESKISHPANVADFESDVTEALVRQIFQDLQKDHPTAFFLAFGKNLTSPSPGFLSRFQNFDPPVKRFESSVMPPNGMIIDASNGRVGAIVQVIRIKPVIAGECDVEVALSSAQWEHFIYRVSQLGGEWRVKGCKPA
jgi:hypothetical protein